MHVALIFDDGSSITEDFDVIQTLAVREDNGRLCSVTVRGNGTREGAEAIVAMTAAEFHALRLEADKPIEGEDEAVARRRSRLKLLKAVGDARKVINNGQGAR